MTKGPLIDAVIAQMQDEAFRSGFMSAVKAVKRYDTGGPTGTNNQSQTQYGLYPLLLSDGRYTYATDTGLPIHYDEEGNVVMPQGTKGTMTTPEVIVTTRDPRKYSSANQPGEVMADSFRSAAEGALNMGSTVFSRWLNPYLRLANSAAKTYDYITSENEEEKRNRIMRGKRESRPYTIHDDFWAGAKTDGDTFYSGKSRYSYSDYRGPETVELSRLGMLGLTYGGEDKNGNTYYTIRDDKGNVVKECAKTGNLLTRAMGRPTTSNAWTRVGVYGDSLITGSDLPHIKNKVLTGIQKLAENVAVDDDPQNLQSGDIVDLYSPVSHYNKRATREGRGNSHTGTIFRPDPEGPAWVIHNVNGKIYVDPYSKFTSLPDIYWKATRVSRPGTKDHPYK